MVFFKNIENPISFLLDFGVYYELTFNNMHCYKYDPPGDEMIIVADPDRLISAQKMVKALEDRKYIQITNL